MTTHVWRWMTSMATDGLSETIRKKLASGTGRDAQTIAASTVDLWQQIAGQLSPVIGVRGVEVLLSRSLHLLSTPYPWLGRPGSAGATPAQTLGAQLERREAREAAEAGTAVLARFLELLGAMIGTRLSEQLLAPLNKENAS